MRLSWFSGSVGHFIAAAILLVCTSSAWAQLPAFPGAEGAGKFTLGGRGGNVYHVTSLADYGTGTPIPGTLRYGLEEVAEVNQANNLTIVFDVGGQINLQSLLQAKRTHNITIAGQTAPGGGMPDAYENTISYLDPNNAADHNLDMNGNGYTDLEDYLNFLVAPVENPLLAGDYNNDGVVDAADFTVWRDSLASNTPLVNETTSLGVVDAEDYDAWKSNFGASDLGAGSASVAAPEPAGGLLVLIGALGVLLHGRTRRSAG